MLRSRGDDGRDLHEIEIYTAGGGIPLRSRATGTRRQNVFDLDKWFTDPEAGMVYRLTLQAMEPT